jgi:DUF1680 family protein
MPFRKQNKAIGHAVRANYLYAGVADVYAETGDDSLLTCLNNIWDDVVSKKIYITGGCGALYDGTSPDGISYDPGKIQKVHQAFGRDYQLPNLTAHNESCANIGNMLWNWRMLQVTGKAQFADAMELELYNSILAGVSLSGKKYFYTNPLSVNDDLPYKLRWSKEREEYIKLCNCCPPNTIRTIAEVSSYVYSINNKGLYFNLYASSHLNTSLKDGSNLKLTQKTEYPWDGKIKILMEQVPNKEFSLFLRIPGWCDDAMVMINGNNSNAKVKPGEYAEINRKWLKGDVIELTLPMPVKLMEANPLVEENRNLVAVKRGPVVYCLESVDFSNKTKIFNIVLPAKIDLVPKPIQIDNSNIVSLEGEAKLIENSGWNNALYKEISEDVTHTVNIRLIPYYAWGNRGHSEMTVWIPLSR